MHSVLAGFFRQHRFASLTLETPLPAPSHDPFPALEEQHTISLNVRNIVFSTLFCKM